MRTFFLHQSGFSKDIWERMDKKSVWCCWCDAQGCGGRIWKPERGLVYCNFTFILLARSWPASTLQVKTLSLTQSKALPSILGHLWIGSSWKRLLWVSVQLCNSPLDSSVGTTLPEASGAGIKLRAITFAFQEVTGKHPLLGCFQICHLAGSQACRSARKCISYKSLLESRCWNKAELPVSEDNVCFARESHLLRQNLCVLFFCYSWVLNCKWELMRENPCKMPHGVRRVADV